MTCALLQLRCIILRHFQGTFWYHSHFSNQYCDGLRGAFVVRDPEDPHANLYDIDDGILSPALYSILKHDSMLIQILQSSHLQTGALHSRDITFIAI